MSGLTDLSSSSRPAFLSCCCVCAGPASEHFLPSNLSTVVLAAGEQLARSALVTVYQTNNNIGSVGSKSITLVSLESDGTFLPAVSLNETAPAPPSRRLTFIGDRLVQYSKHLSLIVIYGSIKLRHVLQMTTVSVNFTPN